MVRVAILGTPCLGRGAGRGVVLVVGPRRFRATHAGKGRAMSDVHVVPHGDSWALELSGEKQETFDNQDQAIQRGRELAEQEDGELVIHGEGGQIREKDSRRHDPREIPW